jgi:RNA polymerase sigma-70 factor, ECF subfamily
MEPDRDDDALLLAAADDPEAFARFYRAHVRGVIAYFRRRVGDAELAADLTAETFAAALAGRWRFAPERGPAAAWLYGIARRQLVTFHRRGHVERRARRRMGMARIELTDEMLERVEAVADAELAQVDVALAALPEDQRGGPRVHRRGPRLRRDRGHAGDLRARGAPARLARGLAALRARMSSQEQQ